MNTNAASTKTLRTRVLTTVAIALLGATLASPAAHAQAGTARATVQYGDLKLDSNAGAERLYSRLRAAAVVVCDASSAWDVKAKSEVRECRRQTIEKAVAQLNHPAFSAWYAARMGRDNADRLVASK